MDILYLEKFNRFKKGLLFESLPKDKQDFIQKIALDYRFSFQELKFVTEFALDLEMWGESSIVFLWDEAELEIPKKTDEQVKQRKKKVLSLIEKKRFLLVNKEKDYLNFSAEWKPFRQEFSEEEAFGNIFGDCPVYSEKTVCCGLKTLDAVKNCGYGCSYCTIQTFYDEQKKVVFLKNLLAKIEEIKLDPEQFYHIGTGQSSDSLLWGNKFGLLDALFDFAEKNRNILLEFKTKSANVEYFKKNHIPKNVVCSWSLNTETIIKHEEHFTASLKERLLAAREVADKGCLVAFHFHPMVYYAGWEKEYKHVVDQVKTLFRPEEIHFISLGTLTFIKPVIQEIRKRAFKTKILQMPLEADPHGKLTYPLDIKLKLFRFMDSAFSDWKDKVFIYLCMERAEVWDALWGWHYTEKEKFLENFKLK